MSTASITDSKTVAPAPSRSSHARLAEYKRTWYFFRRNTLAMVGLGILLFIVAVGIYAVFTPISWNAMALFCGTNGGPPPAGCSNVICTYQVATPSTPPGCIQTPLGYPGFVAPTLSLATLSAGALPFGSLSTTSGTTQYFYSIFQGLLRGTDWTLLISVTIVAGGAVIGLLLGALSGYMGGWVDETIMRIVDIFLSIPQILFVIIVVAVVSTDLAGSSFSVSYLRIYLLIGAFVVVWWPFYARIVRGQVLVVREQKYVEAAKASGAKSRRIIMRHIIPNSVYPVFVQMSLDVGTIPLLIGALIFLGFPIFPSQYFPEWGSIAAHAVDTQMVETIFQNCQIGICSVPWWQLFFPGVALFAFAISVNLFSDGIRDALDPRMRR